MLLPMLYSKEKKNLLLSLWLALHVCTLVSCFIMWFKWEIPGDLNMFLPTTRRGIWKDRRQGNSRKKRPANSLLVISNSWFYNHFVREYYYHYYRIYTKVQFCTWLDWKFSVCFNSLLEIPEGIYGSGKQDCQAGFIFNHLALRL